MWCRMSRKIAKFTITAFFRVHFSSIMGQQLHSFLTNPLQLDNWLYFNKMFLIQCFCIHPLTKSTLKHLHMNIWATKGVIIQHIIFPICHIHKLLPHTVTWTWALANKAWMVSLLATTKKSLHGIIQFFAERKSYNSYQEWHSRDFFSWQKSFTFSKNEHLNF